MAIIRSIGSIKPALNIFLSLLFLGFFFYWRDAHDLYYDWLVICGIVFVIAAIVAIAKAPPPPLSETDCTMCKAEGSFTKPSKWLAVAYSGTCYVCLGKSEIKEGHPHFETYQILRKYEHDYDETKEELKKLKLRP